MSPASSLKVTIENTRPVELLDFTRSLLAIGDQFKRDVEEDASREIDVKLYVQELRRGSLVAELSALAPVAGLGATVVQHAAAVVKFVEHIRTVISWLRDGGSKPEKLNASMVKNVMAIVEPVAKDDGANISIAISGDNNNVSISVDSVGANAVQNRGSRYLESLREPSTQTQTKQLMYWHQVRNEEGPATGEKAVIESISDRPIKIFFNSRDLREEMLYGRENPLNEAYLVDVEVQTVRGKIASYKVLQLHDRVPLEGEALPS